jgi:hypothetical protein
LVGHQRKRPVKEERDAESGQRARCKRERHGHSNTSLS